MRRVRWLRTILIDDEKLAMEYLARELASFEEINIVGKYTNPYRALVEVIDEPPEIIFLDIEIPEINGLDLAKRIQEKLPAVHIVFITSYDEYAVQAFEMGTLDYILKPVNAERLKKTMNRILVNEKGNMTCPMVCCFQELRFMYDGDDSRLIDVNWRTSKAKELFSYLIHHRKKPIRKDIIIEDLWADLPIKDKFSLLYTSIYHVRATLKKIGFPIQINSVDGGYRMDMNGVLVDVDEWERTLKEVTHHLPHVAQKYNKIMELYVGDYFEIDHYFWADHERNRLRILLFTYMEKIGDYYFVNNEYTKGVLHLLQFQQAFPYEEKIYFKLIQIYDALGDVRSVHWQYKMLTSMLDKEYGVAPNPTIVKWYNEFQSR